jgi:hypothetical protein
MKNQFLITAFAVLFTANYVHCAELNSPSSKYIHVSVLENFDDGNKKWLKRLKRRNGKKKKCSGLGCTWIKPKK